MTTEFHLSIDEIKVALADSILESAFLRRELAKSQKLIQRLENDNATHKRTIEQLHGSVPLPTSTVADD